MEREDVILFDYSQHGVCDLNSKVGRKGGRYGWSDIILVVSNIIFSYSWRDVKKTLKHKEEEMDINQLCTHHLQIEVSIRAHESGGNKNSNISFINMVEKSPTYE